MNTSKLLLFPPLNLVEGWVGIPICFRIQKKGVTVGYFAPIIDFESIIDEIYQRPSSEDFVYKFSYNNEIVFDRYAVYDGSRVYNNLKDPKFYRNFDDLTSEDYLENSFSQLGANFQIGIAYKEGFQLNSSQSLLLWSWYFISGILFSMLWLFSYWQKRKRQELEQQRDKLKTYNEALEEFTFAASHDLKEPLRTIGSFSSLLKKKYISKLDEKGVECIDYIVRNVSRMNALLEDLLQYVKFVSEEEIQREIVDLGDIVKEVEDSLYTAVKEKNTQITIDDAFPDIYINRLQLYHLMQNLISNAIKFNDKKMQHIHIGSKRQNGKHIFFVKDNGIGIKKEYHQKIFKSFQRLNVQDFKGSGLGLSICNRIIEKNNGSLWLESKEDKGTTFFFSL